MVSDVRIHYGSVFIPYFILRLNYFKLLVMRNRVVSYSISDINVCAISPISGGNDSRKRHEKHLIFKIGTIHFSHVIISLI